MRNPCYHLLDADSPSIQVVLCVCYSRTDFWDMLSTQLFRLLRSDA